MSDPQPSGPAAGDVRASETPSAASAAAPSASARPLLVGLLALIPLAVLAGLLPATWTGAALLAVSVSLAGLVGVAGYLAGARRRREPPPGARRRALSAQSFDEMSSRLVKAWSEATKRGELAKAAEARLRESEARTRLIIDTAIDAVVTLDATGRITGWSSRSESLFGWATADALGKRMSELIIAPRHWENLEQCLAYFLTTGEWPILNTRVEMSAVHRDGREFPVEVSISPARSGDVCIFGAFLRDITERKRADRELLQAKVAAEEANRSKSVFLANMSHELRTPLNAIMGYSEMLQEEVQGFGHPEIVPDLQRINIAGKHLLTLINDVLDLSKIEAGRMMLSLETFDVAAMVRDVLATIQPLVDKRANVLRVHWGADLGAMRGDLTRMRQILFNLISNATKFTEKGSVTLGVSRESVQGRDWMIFRVSDTGIGMTPEQMQKLFQAFSQAESSTTRKYGGTGLGLAISEKLCGMMGGEILVDSVHGRGSTFTVRVPAEIGPPDGGEASGAPEGVPADVTVPAAPGRDQLLVVDDDPVIRDLITRFLVQEKFTVASAANGTEGLHLARSLRPQAIILDIMMPGRDGWSVLREIKADPDLASIPVILVSILDDADMGFALGAADYLTKPLDRARLAETVRKYHTSGAIARVLLVDDDADTRAVMRCALEGAGWTVTEARNGLVALEQVAQARPDLILLDLMMPEMDGFRFLAEFRKNAAWRKVPVIVMTAMSLTEDERLRLRRDNVEQIVEKGGAARERLLREISGLASDYARAGAGAGRQG